MTVRYYTNMPLSVGILRAMIAASLNTSTKSAFILIFSEGNFQAEIQQPLKFVSDCPTMQR